MIDALSLEFMRNAVIAGCFASLICGIIGTFIVVNRLVFLSGGIAHATYGGIGIAAFFGIPYLAGTLGFSLLSAMVMTVVVLKAKERADTFIGILWAVGMATGIILLDLTPGYNVNLMSYLFGSILAVPAADIWWMFGLSIITVISTGYFYRDILAISYESLLEEYSNYGQENVDFIKLNIRHPGSFNNSQVQLTEISFNKGGIFKE